MLSRWAVGPVGSGKSTLIHKAAQEAGLRVETFEIEHQSLSRLVEGIGKLGGVTLDDTSNADVVWLVYGAELCGPTAWKNTPAVKGMRFILKMNDIPAPIRAAKFSTTYFDRVPNHHMLRFVRRLMPSASAERVSEIADQASGDLRQAQILAKMGCHGATDRMPHVYHDTLQLLNPGAAKLPADRVNLDYAQTNALERFDNLDDAARFAETCACADTLSADKYQGQEDQMRKRCPRSMWLHLAGCPAWHVPSFSTCVTKCRFVNWCNRRLLTVNNRQVNSNSILIGQWIGASAHSQSSRGARLCT